MDPTNPEINRMWASHRVNRLLKEADRAGDRSPALPEIIRLGEEFSIVTEYTSFLVLENDAEYQRWKISRKNLERNQAERQAQAQLRSRLDDIRNKALASLGPEAAESMPTIKSRATRLPAPTPMSQPSVPLPQPQNSSAPAPTGRQSWNLGGSGSSPVGPLGVLGAAWLLRRKRKVA